MREPGSLRTARCSGGVQHHRRILRPRRSAFQLVARHRRHVGETQRRRVDSGVPRCIHEEVTATRGRGEPVERGGIGSGCDERRGARILEEERHFWARRRGVQRNRNRPDFQCAVVAGDERRRVRHEKSDTLAGGDPKREQCVADLRAARSAAAKSSGSAPVRNGRAGAVCAACSSSIAVLSTCMTIRLLGQSLVHCAETRLTRPDDVDLSAPDASARRTSDRRRPHGKGGGVEIPSEYTTHIDSNGTAFVVDANLDDIHIKEFPKIELGDINVRLKEIPGDPEAYRRHQSRGHQASPDRHEHLGQGDSGDQVCPDFASRHAGRRARELQCRAVGSRGLPVQRLALRRSANHLRKLRASPDGTLLEGHDGIAACAGVGTPTRARRR